MPLSLRVENPYDFPLNVTRLDIQARTTAPGCDAAANFVVRAPRLAAPLVVPPGRSSLDRLIADPAARPAVTWRSLDVPQNACLGAPLSFSYTGLATR